MHFATFIAKNLLRRRVRSGLTVLGLAVAVGGVVALLGISHNITRSVEGSFERRRVDLVVQQAGKSAGLNSDFREWFVDAARAMPQVEAVAEGVVQLTDMTTAEGNAIQGMVMGWRDDNFGYDELKILHGRRPAAGERQKILLGSTLAANLKKRVGDAVVFGRDDDTNRNRFEVIGVVESADVFENGAAIMRIDEARALTHMQVTGFSVRVRKTGPDPEAEVDAVRKKIEALRDPEDESVQLTALTPASFSQQLSHLKLVRAIAWLVSAVGLVIGVIGMLNTMVMSVVERTQEIGILRAVGWSPLRVVGMILGESVLLGAAAAAVGTAGAVAATYLLTLFPQVNGFIEAGIAPVVVAEGLALTVLIGLVGGAYPAVRAARLLPTEAIRHD